LRAPPRGVGRSRLKTVHHAGPKLLLASEYLCYHSPRRCRLSLAEYYFSRWRLGFLS
jgi:hypothetical protein